MFPELKLCISEALHSRSQSSMFQSRALCSRSSVFPKLKLCVPEVKAVCSEALCSRSLSYVFLELQLCVLETLYSRS